MAKPMSVKVPSVADIFVKAQEIDSAPGMAGSLDASTFGGGAEEGGNVGMGGADQGAMQPIYPQQQVPLSNIVDRRYEIRKMMKGFDKTISICEEKKNMLAQLLQSNGEETTRFLDDPSTWDEKTWHDTVRRVERLVRDSNEILMSTTTTDIEPESKGETLPRRPDYSSIYMKGKERGN